MVFIDPNPSDDIWKAIGRLPRLRRRWWKLIIRQELGLSGHSSSDTNRVIRMAAFEKFEFTLSIRPAMLDIQHPKKMSLSQIQIYPIFLKCKA